MHRWLICVAASKSRIVRKIRWNKWQLLSVDGLPGQHRNGISSHVQPPLYWNVSPKHHRIQQQQAKKPNIKWHFLAPLNYLFRSFSIANRLFARFHFRFFFWSEISFCIKLTKKNYCTKFIELRSEQNDDKNKQTKAIIHIINVFRKRDKMLNSVF